MKTTKNCIAIVQNDTMIANTWLAEHAIYKYIAVSLLGGIYVYRVAIALELLANLVDYYYCVITYLLKNPSTTIHAYTEVAMQLLGRA